MEPSSILLVGRGYAGPDRRGLIGKMARQVQPPIVAAVVVVSIAFALVAARLAGAVSTRDAAWLTGLGDATFVAAALAAAFFLLRWRLVGDASCVALAALVSVCGLLFVPVVTRSLTVSTGVATELRAMATIAVAGLTATTLRSPEVRSDLRPARFFAVVIVVTSAVTIPLALSPVVRLGWANPSGVRVVDVADSVVAAALAVIVFRRASLFRRLSLYGLAGLLLAMAGASAGIAVHIAGAWRSLPSTLLLVGMVEVLAVAASQLRVAVEAVIVHDVRGRRRWEAAESQLLEARNRIQIQRHDVCSMLSAIDGTLLVLTTQRDRLPAQDTDRLLVAVRDEVHWLQHLVDGGDDARSSFDPCDLIDAVVSVRRTAAIDIRCDLEAGLKLHGRPDRLAVALDNLLANAAIHAPNSRVVVSARRLEHLRGGAIEICVSDDGPGLSALEMVHACEPGWRGEGAALRPGSGLGLGQCRDLVEAEGGSVVIEPSDADAGTGHQGLTVRMRFSSRTHERVDEGDARRASRAVRAEQLAR